MGNHHDSHIKVFMKVGDQLIKLCSGNRVEARFEDLPWAVLPDLMRAGLDFHGAAGRARDDIAGGLVGASAAKRKKGDKLREREPC